MSFVLEYHRLFSVSVLEDGSGTRLPAFRFAPTSATSRVLADHQLRFKPRAAGFEVFYRSNPLAADPLLGRIGARVQMTFAAELMEADFFARYLPDLTDDTGPQLYLDNLTGSGNIQAASNQRLMVGSVVQTDDAIKVRPSIFTARADAGGGLTRFVVRDKFDATTIIADVPAVANGATASAKIDLSTGKPGPYTIETDAAGSSPRTIYVDEHLASRRIAGVVDVHWETPQNTAPADGQPYVIRFQKR